MIRFDPLRLTVPHRPVVTAVVRKLFFSRWLQRWTASTTTKLTIVDGDGIKKVCSSLLLPFFWYLPLLILMLLLLDRRRM